MKTTYKPTCSRRKNPDPLLLWARNCAASPARYGATDREGRIVAELLAEAEASR